MKLESQKKQCENHGKTAKSLKSQVIFTKNQAMQGITMQKNFEELLFFRLRNPFTTLPFPYFFPQTSYKSKKILTFACWKTST